LRANHELKGPIEMTPKQELDFTVWSTLYDVLANVGVNILCQPFDKAGHIVKDKKPVRLTVEAHRPPQSGPNCLPELQLFLREVSITYAARRTLGVLFPSGKFVLENKQDRWFSHEQRRGVWNMMKQLNTAPEATFAHYGLETGECGICGKTLTDPESIARGIGPVCNSRLQRQLRMPAGAPRSLGDLFLSPPAGSSANPLDLNTQKEK